MTTENCTEQFIAYARAKIRRDKIYKALFFAACGALVTTLLALGIRR